MVFNSMSCRTNALRVLLVSPLPPPASGIASWTVMVLRAAIDGQDVAMTHVDTAVRWRSTNDAIFWKRLIGGSMQAFRDSFRVLLALRKARPAVVHLCTSGSLGIPKDILMLALARMCRARTVLHYRRGDLPDIVRGRGLEWWLMRLSLRFADTFLLLDQKSEEAALIATNGIHLKRIPNPVDIEMMRKIAASKCREPKEHRPRRLVYAGWVVPTKGVRELVEACNVIENVPFELDLVGNVLDAFGQELKTISAQRDGGKWLRFHGMRAHREALELIGKADIFILPSYTEGFPNVVLEAMALGVPIIATRVGAIPEMLGENTENACGVLINPRSVAELHDALLDFLTHPEKAKGYGERAQRKASERYSMGEVMRQYMELWRSF